MGGLFFSGNTLNANGNTMGQSEEKLGEKDRAILKLLLKGGRKTYTEIGEEIGLSPPSVSLHIEKMQKKGIIKRFCPNIDFSKIGLNPFFVFIQVKPGQVQKVKEHIKREPRVIFLATITGEYDLILYCLFKNRKNLSDFVQGILEEGLAESTVTSQILELEKDTISPNLLDF